jgi:hypothetical protein
LLEEGPSVGVVFVALDDSPDRPPTEAEVQRLVVRSEAIIGSPHPLQRTLETLMSASADRNAGSAATRLAFPAVR